jgi:hypothetical protein
LITPSTVYQVSSLQMSDPAVTVTTASLVTSVNAYANSAACLLWTIVILVNCCEVKLTRKVFTMMTTGCAGLVICFVFRLAYWWRSTQGYADWATTTGLFVMLNLGDLIHRIAFMQMYRLKYYSIASAGSNGAAMSSKHLDMVVTAIQVLYVCSVIPANLLGPLTWFVGGSYSGRSAFLANNTWISGVTVMESFLKSLIVLYVEGRYFMWTTQRQSLKRSSASGGKGGKSEYGIFNWIQLVKFGLLVSVIFLMLIFGSLSLVPTLPQFSQTWVIIQNVSFVIPAQLCIDFYKYNPDITGGTFSNGSHENSAAHNTAAVRSAA